MRLSSLRFVAALLLTAPSYSQATWYVDPQASGPGTGTLNDPYASLQYALLQPTSQSGDTFDIREGTIAENIVHPQGLANITIRSSQVFGGQVVFDGMGLGPCYRQTALGVERVTFRGFLEFRNGMGAPSSQGLAGGALRFSRADLHIGIIDDDFIRFENNRAEVGAAIYVSNGNLEMASATFTGNIAEPLGGSLAPRGGAVHIRSSDGSHSLGIDQCNFFSNRAEVGGAIYAENVSANMLFSQVIQNEATGYQGVQDGRGGGLALVNTTMNMLAEVGVQSNLSFSGGGVHMTESILQLGGAFIVSNQATDGCGTTAFQANGGGVWADATSEIAGTSSTFFSSNVACSEGGGIYGGGLIDGFPVQNNTSTRGAGIATAGVVTGATITGNRTTAQDSGEVLGGGVFGYGSTELIDCNIEGNVSEGGGGGAYACVLKDCLVDDNEAIYTQSGDPAAAGGGILNCTATDCTISGNRAQQGGGAHSSDLTSCQISGNRAELQVETFDMIGGGVFGCTVVDSELTLNSAVTDQQVDADVLGGGAAFSNLLGCRVASNVAMNNGFASGIDEHGGGLYESQADRCEILGNVASDPDTATSRGGGAYGGQLTRCLIVGNDADYGGGADHSNLERCTVTNNGGEFGGTVDARNCILYFNIGGFDGGITYCLVDGIGSGTNISGDPLFITTAQGSYSLSMASPCVDAGDPSTFDPDGTRADMGAFPLDTFGINIGTTFCYSTPNSTGADARLSILGSTVISENNVGLRVVDLPPNNAGYMIMSVNPTFVPLFNGSQGNLCIGSPRIRFNQFVQNSGAAGAVLFPLDLNALPQGTTFLPGELWNFQYWTRDTNPGPTSNTSSGAYVTFE